MAGYSGNMYDEDESATSSTGSPALDEKPDKSDETEDKLALVPTSFFSEPPKPGRREQVEIVHVYENEVSIKCVYDEKEDKGEEQREMSEGEEPEDSMMM